MVALVRRSNGLLFRQNGLLIRATAASLAAYRRCCCEPVTENCDDCPYGTPDMGPPSDPVVDTLYARITNVTGCECLDGLCIPLSWLGEDHASGGSWSGTAAIPCTAPTEQYLTLALSCCPTGWRLGTDDCTSGASPGHGGACTPLSPPINAAFDVEPGWTCRPYVMSFKDLSGLTCCGGESATFDVDITETPC